MIFSDREVNVGRDALERQLPPMLMAGDVIQFRRPSHLGAFLGEELANNRLMAVDLIGAPLYKQVLFSVQIQGEPGNVTHIPGSVVHRQGDVVGLHLQCNDVILETIERFLRATGWSKSSGFSSGPLVYFSFLLLCFFLALFLFHTFSAPF